MLQLRRETPRGPVPVVEGQLEGPRRGDAEMYRGLWRRKLSSGEEDAREIKFKKHQIRGWMAASAAVLQGKGLRRRSASFTGTGKSPRQVAKLSRPFISMFYLSMLN